MTDLLNPSAGLEPEGTPGADDASKRSGLLRSVTTTALAVLGGFAIGGLLLAIAGAPPLEAYADLFRGAFGSRNAIERVLVEAAPLLIIALGLTIAYRAKVWNIGAQGQFDAGATAAAALALALPGVAGWALIPMSLVVAAIAGAAIGALIGFLRARYDANVVITSLMLNYVAFFFLAWVVRRPLRDPAGFLPQSARVPDDARLPLLFDSRVNVGLVIALVLAVAVWWLFRRTATGFSLDLIGQSSDVAEAVGRPVRRLIVGAAAASAAFAGLAGGIQLLGSEFRLAQTISSGVGFTAIVVALLGRLRPAGVVLSAIFIAGLEVGGDAMQRTQGIPGAAVRVIQAIFVIFLLVAHRVSERGR